MITITPFKGEFCQKERTIYAINNTNPTGLCYGSVTTSEECPYCKERHIFRLYDAKDDYETSHSYIDVYDCKCPSCNKEFDLKIENLKDLD